MMSYRDYWPLNNPMFYNFDKLLFDIQVNDSNIFMCGQRNYFVVSPTDSLLLFKSWFLQTDTKGCLQPGCDSVDIRWNAVANISASNKNIIKVSVYPNPTANMVQVHTNLNLFLLEVYNSQGTKIIKEQSGYTKQINLQNHAAGLYYIRVSKDVVVKTIKVLKE